MSPNCAWKGRKTDRACPKDTDDSFPLKRSKLAVLKTLNISHTSSMFFVSSMKKLLAQPQIRIEEAIATLGMDTHTRRAVVAGTVAIVVSTSRSIIGRRTVGRDDGAHIDAVGQLINEVRRQTVPNIIFGGAKVYVSKFVVGVRRSDTNDYGKSTPIELLRTTDRVT